LQRDELVTILLPTYNRPSYLKIALDSAICQSYKNIEIIIIDDSPNNDSESLCLQYGNKLRYFHREERGGIPSAYNFGLKKISGVWCKLMSDDNILAPNCIEKLVNHAFKTNLQILYSDYSLVDEKGIELGIHKKTNYSNYYKFVFSLWKSMPLNNETTLIHKTCFDTVGEFDSNFGSMSDFDWHLRACLVYKCNYIHVPEILFKFRLHKTRASNLELSDHESLRKWNQTEIKIREKNKKLLMKKNIQEWKYFELHQKKYKNILKPYGNPSISVWRKTIQLVPSRIRRFIRRSWNTSVKGFVEFTCPICQMKDIQRLLYVEPSAKSFTCINCNTTFEKKHIKINYK